MADERDLEPWGSDGALSAVAVPRQIELLTDQFYEWEVRGRGWDLYPYPVSLEPPFVPFHGHWVPPLSPGLDDGKRPTLLSSLVDALKRLGTPKERPSFDVDALDWLALAPDPEPYENDAPLVALRLSLPPSLRVGWDATEQFLRSLPVGLRSIAFEIVGRSDAITVGLVAREEDADAIARRLAAHVPGVVVVQTDDLLVSAWTGGEEDARLLVDFALAREFMLPLRSIRGFEPDPLIAVAASLSDLTEGETAVLQVLFEPVRHPWAESILRAVTDNEGKPFFLDASELTSSARAKIRSPLFAAVLRLGVRSPDLARAWAIARSLGGALKTFADPSGNEFIPLTNEDYDAADHEEDLLRRRTRRTGMILSSDELLSLVHPPSASVKEAKLRREERTTRAAPAAAAGRDLLLGTNVHAGKSVEVGLTAEQRSRHIYVVGASGTGKSTLLLSCIVQDLAKGQGLCVLDPHGDLIDHVLARVPEERQSDVILLDPADADFPVGFNILRAHTELEATLLASDLVAVFRRLSTSWGDQMTSVLGNAILAFLESSRGGTLLDLRRFLVEKTFRDEFLSTVKDSEVVYYWRREFPLLERKPQASILTRLDTFLRHKLIRHMVAQQDDRLDFRKVMDERKVLLCRLSQGAIGAENTSLLGTLLVAKLQQTAMSRQDIAEEARQPFYLYIDEFQHFVTPTMEQILSGTRKYRLGLVLAHHDLRQLSSKSPEVLASVLTNPATRICFRIGDQDAKTLAEGFASFEPRDLQNLGTGQAVARIERAEFDFSLDTPKIAEVDEATGRARRDAILARSRAQYATPREEVEAILRAAIADEAPVERAVPRAPTSTPTPKEPTTPVDVPEAPVEERRSKRVRKSAAPVELRTEAAAPAAPSVPTSGRGGPQHKYLQELIKRWAVAHDWQATIEERILDGLGSVDVSLRKGERRVACEIAVTTTVEHEVENIQKCLAAGFDAVVLVSSEKATLRRVRESVSSFTDEQRERIHVTTPEDAFALLESFEAEAAGTTKTVRGYRVKTTYRAVGKGEQAAKREAVSKVVAKALRRLKE